MRKLLFIFIFFTIINLVFAQTAVVDANLLRQIVDLLQGLIQKGQIQVPASLKEEKKIEEAPGALPVEQKVVPVPVKLPKGVKSALPEDVKTEPITPEIIRPILPDEDRSDDVIVQLNNLRITRILLNPGIENVKAIFFAVRDLGWKCLFFESEESATSLPCALELRRSILQKELAIQITEDTILLQRNRQRAKLEDFQVGDKINVYGFMDKDNNSIDALIVRKIVFVPKPLSRPMPIPPPLEPKLPVTSTPRVCIQVITLAYNPQNPLECREFPTPCDVPSGWVKTERCPVKTPTIQTQTLTEAKVEADDTGFYPSVIEVPKGAKVVLYIYVKSDNVYYNGLDFRSEKFKTDPIKPGQSTNVEFLADKDFIIESYWPLSNVKKGELRVVVK